jgi:hypothetical protein
MDSGVGRELGQKNEAGWLKYSHAHKALGGMPLASNPGGEEEQRSRGLSVAIGSVAQTQHWEACLDASLAEAATGQRALAKWHSAREATR